MKYDVGMLLDNGREVMTLAAWGQNMEYLSETSEGKQAVVQRFAESFIGGELDGEGALREWRNILERNEEIRDLVDAVVYAHVQRDKCN